MTGFFTVTTLNASAALFAGIRTVPAPGMMTKVEYRPNGHRWHHRHWHHGHWHYSN
jgi:hypothetical protein